MRSFKFCSCWRAVRFVTLVGAGGVGKTRLALEVAAQQTTCVDGVRLVELAGLTDDTLVSAVVGGELLATRHVLLVLGNCEHVAERVGAPRRGAASRSGPR